MLLYSLLHLTGYDLSLDEIKRFRQLHSKTPGHPENILTPGVEITTGPLGQGFANGVGMGIAQAHLAATFNKKGFPVVDNYIYCICSDGDLMEGVSYEAASLAGHLKLGNLIYLYDDNQITIDGSTDLAFTEDRTKRFEAAGWHVSEVADGNDLKAIEKAIKDAQKVKDRPSLIRVHTIIGFGMPKQGTSKAHSDAPGDEAVRETKRNLGWPEDKQFFIPKEALAHFREAVKAGATAEKDWNALVKQYQKKFDFDNVKLKFTDDSLKAVAKQAVERKVGARGLMKILEELLLDAMYTLPSQKRVKEFVITSEMVERRRAIPGEGLTGIDGAAA